MATAGHGRFAQMYADLTASATGVLTVVPMIVKFQLKGGADTVDVTSCDSNNEEFLASWKKFDLTIEANQDQDSDALYNVVDGLPRAVLLYQNLRTAVVGKRRYNYGPFILSVDESGGAKDKLGVNLTGKAAGTIVRGFA
jgi:hypothetical protein